MCLRSPEPKGLGEGSRYGCPPQGSFVMEENKSVLTVVLPTTSTNLDDYTGHVGYDSSEPLVTFGRTMFEAVLRNR